MKVSSCILFFACLFSLSHCDISRRRASESNHEHGASLESPVSTVEDSKKIAADEVVPREGLVAWYKFKDYSDGIWKSAAGNFEMTVLRGKEDLDVLYKQGYGAAVKVQSLSGSYKTQVTFGRILAQDYTICSITRYTGDKQARILMGSRGTPTSQKGNWLHGHWAGRIGVARYENWGTYRFSIKDLDRQNWLVMCGQNLSPRNLIRANGKNVIAREPGDGPWHVSINTGDRDDTSDWSLMEIITWNRRLKKEEMTAVENYLLNLLKDPVKLHRKQKEKAKGKDSIKDKGVSSISEEDSVGEYFSGYNLFDDDFNKWRRRKLQMMQIEDDDSEKSKPVAASQVVSLSEPEPVAAEQTPATTKAAAQKPVATTKAAAQKPAATTKAAAQKPAKTKAASKPEPNRKQLEAENEDMADKEQQKKEEFLEKKAEREKEAAQQKEALKKEKEKEKILIDKYEDVPREGLVAWFRYKDFDQERKRWKAHKGDYEMQVVSGRNLIEALEKPGFGTSAMIGAVAGPTSSSVTFGEVIKKDFTICSLTRYTGSKQARILTGSFGKDSTSTRGNWFHGHWEGKVGVAHYEGWFTEYEQVPKSLADPFQWIWMCGQSSVGPSFRANGLNIRRDRRGDGPYFLNVNHGGLPALRVQQSNMDTRPDSEKSQEDLERDRKGAETSDWAIAEIITWDRRLDMTEMRLVEAYLESELSLSNIPAHRGKKYDGPKSWGGTNSDMENWHAPGAGGDGIDSLKDVKDTISFEISPKAGDKADPAHAIPESHKDTKATTQKAAASSTKPPNDAGESSKTSVKIETASHEKAVSEDEHEVEKSSDDSKSGRSSLVNHDSSSNSDEDEFEDFTSSDADDDSDVGTYDDPYNNQLYMLEDAVSDSDDFLNGDDSEDDDSGEVDLSTYDDPYNNQIYMTDSEEAVGDSLDEGLDSLEASADLNDGFMSQLADLDKEIADMVSKGHDAVAQDLVGEAREDDEEDLGTYDDPYNNQNYMLEEEMEVGESREMADFRRFLKHREFEDFDMELYFDHGPGPDEEFALGMGYLDDDDLEEMSASEDYTASEDSFDSKFDNLGSHAVSMSDLSLQSVSMLSTPHHSHSKKSETNVAKKSFDDDDDDDDDCSTCGDDDDKQDPDAMEEKKYKKQKKRSREKAVMDPDAAEEAQYKKSNHEKAVSSEQTVSEDDIISKYLNELYLGSEHTQRESQNTQNAVLEKLKAAEEPISNSEDEITVVFDEVAVGMDRRRGGIPKEGMVAWFQYANFDEKRQEWKSSLGEEHEQHKMVLNTGQVHKLEAREFGARAKVGAIAGNWSTSVTFGPIIKEDFTICSISRYTGKFKNRILQGSLVDDNTKGNWVHGHWADRAAVAYYEKWKTSRDNKLKKVNDWLIMCGQNDEHPILHANGMNVANHRIKQNNYNLNINCCGCCHKEGSDWAVAEVMTWDRHLSLLELKKVERYLKRILAEGLDFQEQSAKWDCELDLTTFSGQNVLEKNLNWYVGKDEEHMMIDFKAQQDDLFAKDLQEKTHAQKLKDKLAKEEAEFEAEELRRKKEKVQQLAKENEQKKMELEQKKEAMEAKKMGKPPKKISKSVSFPGSYDKIVKGKKALFLQECTKEFRPVSCSDVVKGSVVVTFQSFLDSSLEKVIRKVSKGGMKLENFELPPGKMLPSEAEKKDEKEENSKSCTDCDEKDEEEKEKEELEEKKKELEEKKKELEEKMKDKDREQTKNEKEKEEEEEEKKEKAQKEDEEDKEESKKSTEKTQKKDEAEEKGEKKKLDEDEEEEKKKSDEKEDRQQTSDEKEEEEKEEKKSTQSKDEEEEKKETKSTRSKDEEIEKEKQKSEEKDRQLEEKENEKQKLQRKLDAIKEKLKKQEKKKEEKDKEKIKDRDSELKDEEIKKEKEKTEEKNQKLKEKDEEKKKLQKKLDSIKKKLKKEEDKQSKDAEKNDVDKADKEEDDEKGAKEEVEKEGENEEIKKDDEDDEEGLSPKKKKKSSSKKADEDEGKKDPADEDDEEEENTPKTKENAEDEAKKEKRKGPDTDDDSDETRRKRKSTKTKDPEDKEESRTKRDQRKKNDPDQKRKPEVDDEKADEGKLPTKKAPAPKAARGTKEDKEKKDKPAEPSKSIDKEKKPKKASVEDDGDEDRPKKEKEKEDQVIPTQKKKDEGDAEEAKEPKDEGDAKEEKKEPKDIDDAKEEKEPKDAEKTDADEPKDNAADDPKDDETKENEDKADDEAEKKEKKPKKKSSTEDEADDDLEKEEKKPKKKSSKADEADDDLEKDKKSSTEDEPEENLSGQDAYDDPVDFGVEVGASLQNDLSNTHAAFSVLVALSLFALSGLSFCICHMFSCKFGGGDSLRVWFDESHGQYELLQDEDI